MRTIPKVFAAFAMVLSLSSLSGVAAFSSTKIDLRGVMVGTTICDEHTGSYTSTVYQCQNDPVGCAKKDGPQITVSLGVEAGVVVAGVNGGISFTFTPPNGCDTMNGSQYEIPNCPQRAGKQVQGSGGNVIKTEVKDCDGVTKKSCANVVANINIAIPASIIQQLENTFHVDLPNSVTFPYAATDCRGTGQGTNMWCPGTNGSPTNYEIINSTCVTAP